MAAGDSSAPTAEAEVREDAEEIMVTDEMADSTPDPPSDNVFGKILGAASQGAVASVVAATLSAVTEPIVNKVLVNRVPLMQALRELEFARVIVFLRTTLATNFIKFPFFEVTNMIMSFVTLPAAIRGAVTGAVFCSLTLPITNYRFRKSMGMDIKLSMLYQAYFPTVLRDIIYGIVRNVVSSYLISLNEDRAKTSWGRCSNMFVTVLLACIISAPGNELRGYCLQDPARFQPFREFFQPHKFIRSTSVGAMIMSISLSVGTLVTPYVESLWTTMRETFRENPTTFLVLLVLCAVLIAVMCGIRRKRKGNESGNTNTRGTELIPGSARDKSSGP